MKRIALLLLLVAGIAYAHQDDTQVGRLKLAHPDLGHEGGSALHSKVRNAWSKISDNINSRLLTADAVADAASVDLTHNFNVDFFDLSITVYERNTGTGELTVKVASGVDIAAKVGNEKNQITITNNTGSTKDLGFLVVHSGTVVASGGGGAGIQANDNGGFESGLTNYSATSGLTLTTIPAEVGNGLNAGKWDAAAATDTFQTDYFPVPPLLGGKSCLAEFYYKWDGGTLTHINVKVEAETAGDRNIAVDLVPTDGEWTPVQVGFVCPSGDNIRLVATATDDAAVILFDEIYLGSDKRIGETAPELTALVTHADPVLSDFDSNTGLTDLSTNSYIKTRRVGDALEFTYKFVFNGVGTSSLTFGFRLQDWLAANLGVSLITTDTVDLDIPASGVYVDTGAKVLNAIVRQDIGDIIWLSDNDAASVLDGDHIGDTTNNFTALSGVVTLPILEWQNQGTSQTVTVNSIKSPLKAGMVMAWPDDNIPTGWLEADGSTISRTDYSDLFASIGTKYGAGDGSTTFKLPDYRGEFLRGHDNGRGADSGRVNGSSQADATAKNGLGLSWTSSNASTNNDTHSHNHTEARIAVEGAAGANIGWADGGTVAGTFNLATDNDTHSHTVNKNQWNSGQSWAEDSETRPRNVAVKWIIKTTNDVLDVSIALPEATATTAGFVKKNRYQSKKLTTDVTTNTVDITDLKFENLEIGKTFRVKLQGAFGSTSGSDFYMLIRHGATLVGQGGLTTNTGSGAFRFSIQSITFVATSDTIVFETLSMTTGDRLFGNDTYGETWAELIKLENFEETDEW